ncbi:hypothetical protein MMC20_004436 [Loxospora ochrophaea]|nr:hypothetical protein [Loxospora ochrophaea]
MSSDSFPFLQLPVELRREVYRYHLVSKKDTLAPQVVQPAHQHRWSTEVQLSGYGELKVDLLQVCKTIHDEASCVLYGLNIFSFDSKPLCCSGGMDTDDSENEEAGNLHDSAVTGMYAFLLGIGRQNRMNLKQVIIRLWDAKMCYCEGERVWQSELLADTSDEFEQCGGEYLCKAFNLLSEGHELQMLRLRFYGQWRKTLACHFFRPTYQSEIMRTLQKITGIADLNYDDFPDTADFNDAEEEAADLKRHMEAPRADRRLATVDKDEARVEGKARDLGHKLMALTRERIILNRKLAEKRKKSRKAQIQQRIAEIDKILKDVETRIG